MRTIAALATENPLDPRYLAWPGWCKRADPLDALMLFYSDGISHTGDNTVTKMKRTSDGGQTFGPAVTVYSEAGMRCSSNMGNIELPSGRILVAITRETNAPIVPQAPIFRATDDGGDTFFTHCTMAVPPGYDWIITYGSITLKNNTLHMAGYGKNTTTGYTDALFFTSPITGDNWTLKSVIKAGTSTDPVNEVDAVSFDADVWFAVMRIETQPKMRVHTTLSADDGTSWATSINHDSGRACSPALLKTSGTSALFGYARRDADSFPMGVVLWRVENAGVGDILTDGTPYQYLYLSLHSPDNADIGYPAFVDAHGPILVAYYDNAHNIIVQSVGLVVAGEGGGCEDPDHVSLIAVKALVQQNVFAGL